MSQESTAFDRRWKRLQQSTGTRSQAGLARALGIRQACVSDAYRRGHIPAEWLASLADRTGLNPEWVLGGDVPKCLNRRANPYLMPTGKAVLGRVPLRYLVGELVRRAAQEEESFPTMETVRQ